MSLLRSGMGILRLRSTQAALMVDPRWTGSENQHPAKSIKDSSGKCYTCFIPSADVSFIPVKTLGGYVLFKLASKLH